MMSKGYAQSTRIKSFWDWCSCFQGDTSKRERKEENRRWDSVSLNLPTVEIIDQEIGDVELFCYIWGILLPRAKEKKLCLYSAMYRLVLGSVLAISWGEVERCLSNQNRSGRGLGQLKGRLKLLEAKQSSQTSATNIIILLKEQKQQWTSVQNNHVNGPYQSHSNEDLQLKTDHGSINTAFCCPHIYSLHPYSH